MTFNPSRRYSELRDREDRLQGDQQDYLRKCGWVWTCDTPGSFWLWKREYKGKVLLVNTDMALIMQRHFNSGVYVPD